MDLPADSEARQAIMIPNDGEVVIEITGENTIIALGTKNTGVIMHNNVDGNSRIVVRGGGKLTTTSASGPFWAADDLLIQNVTIDATTTQDGIRSDHGDITLESVNYTMSSDGISAPCVWTSHGSMTVGNSTLNLTSKGDRGIFVRDGDLTVIDSTVEISAGYDSAISVGVSKETTGGTGYQPGVIPGRKILLSGNTSVSSICTSNYGVYLQGTMTVTAPAQLKAQGSAAAVVTYEGITLDGTAVTAPADGVVSAPTESSNVYTVRDTAGAAQTAADVTPVDLTVNVKSPITYGETTQATVTSNPALNAQVAIYNGETKLGEGNLGDTIALDTSKLDAGDQILTAKLQENKGIVSKDFTLTIEKAIPTVSSHTATAIQYGQRLSDSTLTGEAEYDGTSIEGNLIWTAPNTQPTQSGSFPAQFMPKDSVNYALSEQVETNVVVNPATPNIQINAPDSQQAGQPISVTANVTNPYDAGFTTDLPRATLTYTVNGETKTIKDGKFTIPNDAKAGTKITITATTPAVTGKYAATEQQAVVTIAASPTPCDGGKDCPSHRLTDVNTHEWYHESVDYAVTHGLTQGTSATTFEPLTTTSRAMLVTILYRLDGSPAVGAPTFADVAANQWYSKAVVWAADKGIAVGYGNGKFGPNDTVTREQTATILYRYAQYKGFDMSKLDNLSAYSDAGSIASFAKTPVQWCVENKIISGKPGNLLDPAGNASRAEVAAVLMRFCENIVK